MENPRSTKAFTLVEIIIVLAILGFMGVISLTMYMNSTGTFTFFSNFNSIYSTIRVARSMAINNSDHAGMSPDRYGIYLNVEGDINSSEIIVRLFADTGATPYVYDGPDKDPVAQDAIVQSKNFSISTADYDLILRDSAEVGLIGAVLVFYENGTGEVSILKWNDLLTKYELIPKTDSKYISIELKEDAGKLLNKYIILNQVSGLPEEYETLP
jgi:prepilin-type N-terminal cleavage/methylation domain-containing protein